MFWIILDHKLLKKGNKISDDKEIFGNYLLIFIEPSFNFVGF